MYGCADPAIIYGFPEPDDNRVASYEWLEENGLDGVYSDCIVRNRACGTMYYGVSLMITDTNTIDIPENVRLRVDTIAEQFGVTAHVHVVVSGFDDFEQTIYDPPITVPPV